MLSITPLEDLFWFLVREYEIRYSKLVNVEEQTESFTYRIPIVGNVIIDDGLTSLIKIPLVQRLMQIRQLAHTYLFIPGANHSRFEHSIGVMEIASAIAQLLRRTYSKISEILSEEDVLILKASALLHDLGHSGLGHALDGVTGRLVSHMSEVYEMYLFEPKKLDLAITTYLLLENEQLKRAITEFIGKSRIKYERNLVQKIIAQVVVEEWDPIFSELTSKELKLKYRVMQMILGSIKGIGGINSDRLDWILRDTHHTEAHKYLLEEQHYQTFESKLKELRKFIEELLKGARTGEKDKKIAKKYIEINFQGETPTLKLSSALEEAISYLRGVLYEKIYESFTRSLLDSLYTRLVYTCMRVLSYIGHAVAGLETLTRALIAYLLEPDQVLLDLTSRILRYCKVINIKALYNIDDIMLSFIHRGADLTQLVENITVLTQTILDPKFDSLYVKTFNFNVKVLKRPLVKVGNFSFYLITLDYSHLAEIIQRIARTGKTSGMETDIGTAIRHLLIDRALMDPILTYHIPSIEYTINEDLGPELRRDLGQVDIYLLINYYAFRKLDEVIGNKTAKIENIITILNKHAHTPFMFIIVRTTYTPEVPGQIPSKLRENLEKCAERTINELLTRKISELPI
ncbi:MAG: hypothetical protein DRJ40_02820 [Thermoprotei archaeon]|nr:MAG: hypothetical protein DRJ40_02820 [Thermoprotei archaeon]